MCSLDQPVPWIRQVIDAPVTRQVLRHVARVLPAFLAATTAEMRRPVVQVGAAVIRTIATRAAADRRGEVTVTSHNRCATAPRNRLPRKEQVARGHRAAG